MNVELNKEFGYEQGRRHGVDMLHKTLTQSNDGENLSEIISNDLTTILNQAFIAINHPEKRAIPIALNISKLIGYMERLALVTEALAEGLCFEVNESTDELTIKRRKA